MGCKISLAGVEERFLAGGMTHHSDLEVVDHYFLGHAAKELKGPPMCREEVVHGFGERKLDIEHAAVTEHHDKEGEAPAGGAYRHRAVLAPVHLSAFCGGKLQHEEGRFAHRPDTPH